MKEFWLVTAREIKVRGRTKSYLIGIAVSCLLVGALLSAHRGKAALVYAGG